MAEAKRRTVRVTCRECEWKTDAAVEGPGTVVSCRGCQTEIPLVFSEALQKGDPVDLCACCGRGHLYLQRDFPRTAGCLLIVIGAALVPYTYGLSLILLAAVDLALYKMLPPMTVCYRCRAEYRGFPVNPEHQAFDLHRLEKYEDKSIGTPGPKEAPRREPKGEEEPKEPREDA